jgi:hypothetical protein
MVTLAALLVSAAPFRLEVSLPTTVPSGAPIEVVVRAQNLSGRKLVLVRPELPNGELGVEWKDELRLGGQKIQRVEMGPMMGQWAVGLEIGPERFIVIPAGGSAEIYRERFSGYFPSGRLPTDKREWSAREKPPLPEGSYVYRLRYGFKRRFDRRRSDLRLSTAARLRYEAAWTGQIEGEGRFRVE